jgi:hypothetical protein
MRSRIERSGRAKKRKDLTTRNTKKNKEAQRGRNEYKKNEQERIGRRR